MKVRWTRRAIQDREEIGDHIAKDDPLAAARMEDLFDQAAANLAEFPNLGRPGRLPGTRELVPHRSYRLVYRIHGDTVSIARVVHTARYWPPPAG